MTTIGFIGLGHMGNPMSQHLLKSHFKVCVYDVMPEAREAFKNTAATIATTVKEVAQFADIIITSVQTSEQVNEICLGETGLFAHAKKELLFIDCSSIDITATRLLHQKASENKITMLDAPVSGGVSGAAAATLTFMVGGSEKAYQQAQPILALMGKKIIYAGIAGSGQAAKISNNLLLGISMIGVCEAFGLAKKLGLNAKTFFDISSNASGQCWSMTSYCPMPNILENVPSNHDYEPGFMAKMMLKDLRLGQHAAEAVDALTPLGMLALELYELYVNTGNGEKDFSGIMKLFL